MAVFIELLRSGAWLTRERVRLIGLIMLAAFVLGAGFLIVTSNGLNDRFGRPLGTDFSNVYAAGTYVLDGQPAVPFDPPRQYAREQAIFGPATPFYGWHYPPFFLGLAALLATMPYWLALLVWQGVTLVLYVLCIRAILSSPSLGGGGSRAARGGVNDENSPPPGSLRDIAEASPRRPSIQERPQKAAYASPLQGEVKSDWLLLALAFPAVFINLGQAHNGFLTTALFGAALTQLDKRPWLAGFFFGLLAYKPQFGLLIPLILLVSGRWRVIIAAGVTVAALALAVTLAFGTEVWTAFFASTKFTREVVLEQGQTGWHKIQSVFSWVRMWGGGMSLAYAMQGAVIAAIAGALIWLWRGPATFALKAATLVIGCLLATPYSLDYDLMLLAPAIAYLAIDGFQRGFAPWEKTMLAGLWLVPLVARSVPEATLIPLAVPLMLAAFVLLLHRAMTETRPAQASGIFPRAP
jgi:alpha-1,2-mannosyltransferase